MIDHIPGPYDNKTFAEILHDYVVYRGDIVEDYARQQLVSIVEQRLAAAEQAGYDRAVAEGRNGTAAALVDRVEAFAQDLETDQTSTPADTEDGTFPMSASNWDVALHAIADGLRDAVRATSDVVLATSAPTVEAVVAEIEAVHGPHVECGNAGCRGKGLSGMHCADNDECNEGAHEECPFAILAARLRAATSTVPAAQALRETAYEITAELICCSGEQVHEYEHTICKWAGFAREIVLDRARSIENTTAQVWTHTKDNTPCASDFIPPRIAICGEHGMEVRLERTDGEDE